MGQLSNVPVCESAALAGRDPATSLSCSTEETLLESNAQDAARSRRVEDAIYRRARGYKVSVRKTYKVKRVEYDPDTGKKTCEREELQTGTDEVVVPADVRACAYWLVNRAPARWQEHPAPDAAADAALGGTVDFPPLKQSDEFAEADTDVRDAGVGDGGPS